MPRGQYKRKPRNSGGEQLVETPNAPEMVAHDTVHVHEEALAALDIGTAFVGDGFSFTASDAYRVSIEKSAKSTTHITLVRK